MRLPKWADLHRKQGSQASWLRTLRAAGDAARDRQNWEAAARFYGEAIAIDPSALDITVQLGHAHKELGDYTRASQLYYRVLDETPNDDDLHLQIGHLAKLRGNTVDATFHYKRAVELNSGNLYAQQEYDALEAAKTSLGSGLLDDSRGSNRTRGAHPLRQLSDAALRAVGDEARDARRWAEAAPAYQLYLERVPSDAAIWTQLGHCLKEMGDLVGGEAAYHRGLAQQPADSDLYLQLGHVLKLQERSSEASEAYRRSFVLKPLLATARELRHMGNDLAALEERLAPQARIPEILFEISDLFVDLLDSRTISGIQRVQLGIISHIVAENQRGGASDCRIVLWEGDELWCLRADCLARLLTIYELTGDDALELRREFIEEAMAKAELVRPMRGDVVFSTGSNKRPSVLTDFARLNRAGVRLGAYIHDLTVITHPEFYDQEHIKEIRATLGDAFLYYDFALTVSDYVGCEARQLLEKSGYAPIPIRSVPLPHVFGTGPVAEQDSWTLATAVLQGSEFVLCVGTLFSRKNQVLLLQIWQLLIREGVEPPKLVFVGRRWPGAPGGVLPQIEATNYLDGRVHVFEGLSDAELATLYRNCLFTMFPSFIEGWGLPIGESLAHGKVCIASDTGSHPEVGGDFVLYIDPYNARGGAVLVRQLLDNRAKLRQLEARVQSEFRPRNWDEHGTALIRGLEELGRADPQEGKRPKSITMPFGRVVRPRQIASNQQQYRTRLPPHHITADRALRRLLLEKGWYPMEWWGAWMHGRRGQIGFTIEGEPGGEVRVVLQLQAAPGAQGNSLIIRAGCGASATVSVPEAGGGYPLFLAWLDCIPDATGRIELLLELLGKIPDPRRDETRRFCVGVTRALCLRNAEMDEQLPINRMFRPTALVGPTGGAVAPCGTSLMIAALKRRTVLIDGWREPEHWGAWMASDTARLGLLIEAATGEAIRVVLQLRAPSARYTEVIASSECGATETLRLSAIDPRDFCLWLDCRVGPKGRVTLTLKVKSRSTGTMVDSFPAPLGITGVAYGRQGAVSDRLALAEAVLFPKQAESGEELRAELEAGLRFSVIGHMNGSYSLAAVNRRLALALEEARPGTVRVEQIEGHPVHDLSRVAATEREAITRLAARERDDEGPLVEIVQHWPIWLPPDSADLKLAWVAWEEGVAPFDLVRLINQKFQGVLVQTRFVAKVLIDSGVRLPIRVMGCAIDLAAYTALGAARGAEHGTAPASRPPTKEAPFVFLHVSSCFPRKGVDALIAAYAKAFRRADPVRLIIKGFPNEHNDVPRQIAHSLALDPDAPEIVMINRDMLTRDVIDLYAAAGAVVLPTRGEGFNMPAAEALAAGVPLIVTGYSGHTDFTGPDVARQVAFRFAFSRTHLHLAGSVWAEPDIDDLAAAMREVFDSTGKTVAGRELAARVQRARSAAVPLGDSAAWALRVREITLELLSRGFVQTPMAPTVAWVTTWNIRCGIATYSRYLLDRYPDAARNVTVLCDERTLPEHLTSPGGPVARVAWRTPGDPELVDRIAGAIAEMDARAVVIQHQPGLIGWGELGALLRDDRLGSREIIVVLHTQPNSDFPAHEFRRVSRILVHGVRELNELKARGLVDNVALLPHGALPPTVERRPAQDLLRSAAPVIGSYGFILPHKGFDVLIAALASIRAEWPAARLRMVTAEHPVDESRAVIAQCRVLAQSLGLTDAVEWHIEYLPDDGSLALLNQCDLLVLPYRETGESASGAARVAMASRVPVLVTPVPIFYEMGDAVIRAEGLDSSALASGIAAALRDQKLRHHTVDEADRWLKAYDWARMSERLHGMICGLVANRGALAQPK
jgi:glycosyltransferase involved in cell wall biosynthesis/Flp pilus assembly protein TadD